MTEFVQHPSEILDYSADFASHCIRYREANSDYADDVAVQPRRSTGMQYRSTGPGRTGTNEPRWPTVAGQYVQDGSVTWAAEVASGDSLARILQSAAWTATAGITITPTPIDGTVAAALISGGTDGQDYDVTCVGTCSDGTKPVLTFTVQIRK